MTMTTKTREPPAGVGRLICLARLGQGVGMREFAERAGVSPSRQAAIEQGEWATPDEFERIIATLEELRVASLDWRERVADRLVAAEDELMRLCREVRSAQEYYHDPGGPSVSMASLQELLSRLTPEAEVQRGLPSPSKHEAIANCKARIWFRGQTASLDGEVLVEEVFDDSLTPTSPSLRSTADWVCESLSMYDLPQWLAWCGVPPTGNYEVLIRVRMYVWRTLDGEYDETVEVTPYQRQRLPDDWVFALDDC